MANKERITAEFQRIKSLGFIKSNRSHNTGIGKTFEDYLGVTENNDKLPDFEGFEVKSQRVETGSFLTLFTKSPSGKKGVNNYLRNTYGEFYEEYPTLQRLHTSIFGHKFNTYRNLYGFKIVNNEQLKRIELHVQSLANNEIIDDEVHWTYASLESCLKKKLNSLFYVQADSKVINGEEYFHYTKANVYMTPSLPKLLKLLEDGKLMVDIRIGSYKSGDKIGKVHDHGTGFRIKSQDLNLLYDEHFII